MACKWNFAAGKEVSNPNIGDVRRTREGALHQRGFTDITSSFTFFRILAVKLSDLSGQIIGHRAASVNGHGRKVMLSRQDKGQLTIGHKRQLLTV